MPGSYQVILQLQGYHWFLLKWHLMTLQRLLEWLLVLLPFFPLFHGVFYNYVFLSRHPMLGCWQLFHHLSNDPLLWNTKELRLSSVQHATIPILIRGKNIRTMLRKLNEVKYLMKYEKWSIFLDEIIAEINSKNY